MKLLKWNLWSFILLLVAPIAGAWAADQNQLMRFFADFKTLSGEFSQSLIDNRGKVTQESKGQFWIERPGRFRWDYREPHEQLIVANGSKVWIYDADLEQVTVKNQAQAMGSAPAQLLSEPDSLNKNFTVSSLGTSNGLEWFDLTPKDTETGFDSIKMAFSGPNLHAMELSDALGQTTVLRFTGLVQNKTIDSKLFTFNAPAGVDVITE